MKAQIEICKASLATHSKSFNLAARLLPGETAEEAAVVYAWCRRADDAIDSSRGPAQAAALVRLERELDDLYSGMSLGDPVLDAFQDVTARRQIPAEYPKDLLRGMRMDTEGQVYEDYPDLLTYCYRVASTVGLMMCHVMGLSDPGALRRAAHLGLAMQLTNICRDVVEDWERGRVYVPARVLARHGAPTAAWRPGGPPPAALREVCRGALPELLALADRYYASSDEGLRHLPWRSAIAVNAARRIYCAIGTELERGGYDVMAARAVVPGRAKAWACAKAALFTSLGRLGRLGSRFEPVPLHTVTLGPELFSL
jgi:phytoene synthase